MNNIEKISEELKKVLNKNAPVLTVEQKTFILYLINIKFCDLNFN